MDLLVPGIQEDFCLGIKTIYSDQNSNSFLSSFQLQICRLSSIPLLFNIYLPFLFSEMYILLLHPCCFPTLLILTPGFRNRIMQMEKSGRNKASQFPLVKHHLLLILWKTICMSCITNQSKVYKCCQILTSTERSGFLLFITL